MKRYTDLEQSKRLAEILPIESVDCFWDYDDMIASLITYANNSIENPGGSINGVRFDISQSSYDKLTEDDLAAIVAMGNSVAVV